MSVAILPKAYEADPTTTIGGMPFDEWRWTVPWAMAWMRFESSISRSSRADVVGRSAAAQATAP